MEYLTLKRLHEATEEELIDRIVPREHRAEVLEFFDDLVSSDPLILNLLESTEDNLYILSVEAHYGTETTENALAIAPNADILLPEDASVEILGIILLVRSLISGELKRAEPLEQREITLIRNVLKTKILGLEGPKLDRVFAVSRNIDVKKIKTKLRTLKITLNPFADGEFLVRKSLYGPKFEELLERTLGYYHPMIHAVHESHVLFCFDDGEVIEARQLFQHPYAFLLTEENICPGTLQKFNLTKKKYLLPEDRSHFYTTNRDAKFLNLLLYGILKAHNVRVEIGQLNYTDEQTFNINTFELRGVDTIGPAAYTWSLDGMTLLMREKSVEGLVPAFDKWLYEPTERKFYESQKNEQIELFRATLDSGARYFSPWDIPSLNAREGIAFELRPSPHLLKELYEFQAKLKKKFSIELDLNQIDEAKREDVSSHFEFSYEDKSLLVSFFGESQQEVLDIPSIFSNCFDALQSGIGELHYDKNTNIAARSRGDKRERDLKFLRHAGVFASMLSICLPLVKEDKPLTKKDLNQKQCEVMSFFLSLDQHEEVVANPLFSKYFSGRVAGLARIFLENLLEKTSYEHLCYEEEWKIYSFRQSFFELFSLILNYCGQETNGRFYSKQRFKDISISRDSSNDEVCISFKNANHLLQKITRSAIDPLAITVHGRPIQKLSKDDLKVVFGVREENNSGWFDLHPKVFFRGEKLSDEQAREFIGEDEVVYFENAFYLLDKSEIPSFDWLTYFWEKIQGDSEKKTKRNDRKRSMNNRSLILELFALALSGEEISDFGGFEKQVQAFLKLVQGEKIVESAQFENIVDSKYQLKPFQLEGVEWLVGLSEIGLGGILADDMGLGKTIQTLAYLSFLEKTKKLGPSLIIVPTSLLYNWQSEAQKFTPHLPVIVCETGKELKAAFSDSNNPGVLVTTYGLFHRHSNLIQGCQYDRVIFDEAQVIKNAGTQKSDLANQIMANQKICLTGTPLENHLGEFYTLIDLCVPGALGDFDSFAYTYALGQTHKAPSKQAMSVLKKKIRPLVLRRTKENVIKELPEKSETVIQIPFGQQQKKIYKNVALSFNNLIQQQINEGQDNHQLQMLTALLRLRQICTSPRLLPESYESEESPKLEAIIPKLKEVVELGQSALVFTNFKASLFLLQSKLKKLGLSPYIISGDVPAKKRKLIVKEFSESPKPEILLMTLKTGGVGLNLTKASYVFHLEPWWNPAAENQGTDRTYRIGQRKNVSVYRYIMKDSVEQRIQDLKLHKSKIFNALFSEDEDEALKENLKTATRSLSLEDFRYLLSTNM